MNKLSSLKLRACRRSPTALALAAALLCTSLHAQPFPTIGDYGDAPDGIPAYPWLGILGEYPTCFGGPSGHISHANNTPVAYWGATMDPEPDGNGGFCPPGPYENDECWAALDGDAGLVFPDAFTILAGLPVPCSGSPTPRALGPACSLANWGPMGNLDLLLSNNAGNDVVVNILFDWNRDGRWGGQSSCGPNVAPEHAVVDLHVPAGFSGPVSHLLPPSFLIGPNPGFVWARFTVSDEFPPMPPDWHGDGDFDTGETEDYLFLVGQGGGGGDPGFGELGDAPEGVEAYPGVIGSFPTCIGGPAGYVHHQPVTSAWFGDALDHEPDGNAGICPPAPYDQDECFELPGTPGRDAGLITPHPFTLDAGVVERCPASAGGSLGAICSRAAWGADLDIEVVNTSNQDRYVNVLVDWSGDGSWTPNLFTCPNGDTGSEHILVNHVVPAGFNGPLSLLAPPTFLSGYASGLAWARFTLSDTPVPADWDGQGAFLDGETEDYLFAVGASASAARDAAPQLGLTVEPNVPNPFNPRTTIAFTATTAGRHTVTVTDLAGREVATLLDRELPAGRHDVDWDGRGQDGGELPSGVYFARVRGGGAVESVKMLLVR
ncbi:MAG: T9SS type A sorting domain-containing protein [bacterium]|nr:T9SS type A sorting domain-containing protein [bacterium]